MPNNRKSYWEAEMRDGAHAKALMADRARGVMSTKFTTWVCRKCGTKNPEWAERCQGCDKRH